METRSINSTLFNRPPFDNQRFEVISIHESYLYENPLPSQFLATGVKKYGISGAYTICDTPNLLDETACLLSKVAIATPECVLIVTLDFEASPGQYVNHSCLYDNFFDAEGEPSTFIGFNLDRLTLQLYAEYGLFIRHGIDLLALSLDGIISTPRSVKTFITTYKQDVNPNGLAKLLLSEEDTVEGDLELATRAWAGAIMDQVSEHLAGAIGAADAVNILNLEDVERVALNRVMLSSDRLRLSAEEFQKHDIELIRKGSKFFAVSQQFNTRVRNSDLEFEITFENEIVNAKIVSVKGTKALLKLTAPIDLEEAGKVVQALTLGRPEATSLENQKHNIVLFALQGKLSLLQNPLLAQIWFPDRIESFVSSAATPTLLGEEVKKLNESQTNAAIEMLKKDLQPRIVLIHGPPGTGKTSVICAMAQSLLLSGMEDDQADQKPEESKVTARYEHESEEGEDVDLQGPMVWIIAQSNVAVKNVAEKLVKIGLLQFKILVSEDFHFEWHEDLYEKMPNMTTTKGLPHNSGEVKTWLGSAQIILSTLSMITSPVLMKVSFHDFAPVHNVIIDEASQIQIGDLLPLIHYFGTGIERICLVGDHKQLAPYGQEQIKGLQSIFEMEHIVDRAVMLSETYRLPQPICDIISRNVYDNKLDSQHKETRNTCCKWIDIADGEEEADSHSFINRKEVEAVILLAKELTEKKKEFKIISPYATQTDLIMKSLKELGLPWENMCFNVDSFQGNEADFIIISLVRTRTVGFLDNDRRANVLLTRCRKGMFVVCNRNLIVSEKGRNTLLGKFALAWTGNQQWSKSNYKWPTFQDLDEDKIYNIVDPDLPGEAPVNPPGSSKGQISKQDKGRKKRARKNK